MQLLVMLATIAALTSIASAATNAVASKAAHTALSVSIGSLSQPVSGKAVIVTARVSGTTPVRSVVFRVDGKALGTLTAAPYQLSWDSTTVANGTHTLRAVASGVNGSKASDDKSVRVKNGSSTPPPVTTTTTTTTTTTDPATPPPPTTTTPPSPPPTTTTQAPPPPTTTTTTTPAPPAGPQTLFADSFDAPNGSNNLITNEYSYWNSSDRKSVSSPNWEMTSGSFFSVGGLGWSGRPDDCEPDATSQNCTDSAIFRLTSKQDFGDAAVNFQLRINSLTTTGSTPAVDWDGIHIFLRYQSEYQLYYASVARRDGRVVIKKKCVGGSDNGGTYYELTPEGPGHSIPTGSWMNVGASAVDNPDGSVTLRLYRDGILLAQATDTGIGCAPITQPGKVGIRGDNADFDVDNFTVTTAS